MTRGKDGSWTITIPLQPGTYGYKFLVNGSEWLIDPQTTLRKQVNGIENSAVEVTEESTIAPSPALPLQRPPPPRATSARASYPSRRGM